MRSVRTLIADDSRTYRAILTRTLAEIGGAEVVGEASDGAEAWSLVQSLTPDLLLLDLEMPELGGLEVLERVRRDYPDLAVAIVSSSDQASDAMKALANGALEIVHKPQGGGAIGSLRSSLRRVVRAASRLLVDGEQAQKAAPEAAAQPEPLVSSGPEFELVVIAVSTGGPSALDQVIPKLPSSFPVPVIIVQHLPRGFMEELASRLDRKSELEVRVARDGEELPKTGVRFAEAGTHLELRRHDAGGGSYRLWEKEGPRVHGCRPAADVLLQSVARDFRGRVLCLVLTGMGRDGRDGIQALDRSRTYTIAQDRESSTVYGMPRAIAEANLADVQLPLDQIADKLQQLVSGGH